MVLPPEICPAPEVGAHPAAPVFGDLGFARGPPGAARSRRPGSSAGCRRAAYLCRISARRTSTIRRTTSGSRVNSPPTSRSRCTGGRAARSCRGGVGGLGGRGGAMGGSLRHRGDGRKGSSETVVAPRLRVGPTLELPAFAARRTRDTLRPVIRAGLRRAPFVVRRGGRLSLPLPRPPDEQTRRQARG